MQARKSTVALAFALLGLAPSLTLAKPGEAIPPEARANPALWPEASSPAAITDAKTEKQIDALLTKMTLRKRWGS